MRNYVYLKYLINAYIILQTMNEICLTMNEWMNIFIKLIYFNLIYLNNII